MTIRRSDIVETISYVAALITPGNQELVRQGKGDALAQYRQNIFKIVQESTGMDLLHYELSQQGFYLKQR